MADMQVEKPPLRSKFAQSGKDLSSACSLFCEYPDGLCLFVIGCD